MPVYLLSIWNISMYTRVIHYMYEGYVCQLLVSYVLPDRYPVTSDGIVISNLVWLKTTFSIILLFTVLVILIPTKRAFSECRKSTAFWRKHHTLIVEWFFRFLTEGNVSFCCLMQTCFESYMKKLRHSFQGHETKVESDAKPKAMIKRNEVW